ncbi:4Fe-4S dicluster domain-containing protein [Psychromonas sp. MME2]|uniref:4Fe-4S binding protein n=1 Tax=unclassified Psychromonas TaxID=2614957 RepID=UPI00339C6870
MALQIGKKCFSCYACETVCPEEAISQTNNIFSINATLCSECQDLATPRCIAICPEAGAITKVES